MFEARHLRVLRAVARTGSFSGAARELGCTQPAVSQQMKALELSAGTPLLVRTGRRMRLTEAGESLARHAAGILAGLAAAEEEVAAIAGLRAGRVRLVSFPSASSTLVPGAVAAMRRAHPGTRVLLQDAEPPRSVELLRAGDCEIALAFRYPAVGRTPFRRSQRPVEDEWADLVVRPLLTERLVALLPAGHRLVADRSAGSPPLRLADLADEQWIAGCPRCRGHLVELCEAAGFSPRIDFATDDPPAIAGLVGAGLGVAMLPGLALEAVRPRNVAVVGVEPEARREVVALTLPDQARVPAVAGLLERLRESAPR